MRTGLTMKDVAKVEKIYLVVVDPVDEVAGLGVDPGVAWLGTAVAPADDALKFLVRILGIICSLSLRS